MQKKNLPNRKTIALGYVSQAVNISFGILLLPVLVMKLSMEEIGLWYVYLAIYGFVILMDFGFSPIITRHVVYLTAGADQIMCRGFSSLDDGEGNVDWELLATFIKAVRVIYAMLGMGAVIILSIVTKFYIIDVLSIRYSLDRAALISWIIFASAIAINIFFLYYSSILLGLGRLKENYLSIIINKFLSISLSVGLVFIGAGLVGLAVGFLFGIIVFRVACWFYLLKTEFRSVIRIKTSRSQVAEMLKKIWPNSWRMGLVSISSFFVRKVSPLIIAAYLSLEVTARYSITLTVLTLILNISLIYFNIHAPIISDARIRKKNMRISLIYGEAFVVMTITFLAAVAAIILMITINLGIDKITNSFLDEKLIIVMLLILFLEGGHNIAAGIIASKNEIPFTKSAVISGLLIVMFQFIFLKYTNLGVWSVVIVQGLVQLAYNNWKWPVFVLKDLNLNFCDVPYLGLRSLKRKLNVFK